MEAQGQSSSYENGAKGFAPDEKIISLFQPDTLLSTQYFDNLRRTTLFEPEKRLMLAILEEGIHGYLDNLNASGGKKKRDLDEAAAWIVDLDSDWIFSFPSVCDALGLNPEYVRQGLLRWKERHGKTPTRATSATAKKLAV